MSESRSIRVWGAGLALWGVVFSLILPCSVPRAHAEKPDEARSYRDPAIAFEKNLGQFDPRVIFAGKGNGQTVFLTADEATFVMPMPVAKNEGEGPAEERSIYALKMKFAGANPKTETVFEGELQGKLGYFKGNDHSKWVPEVPRYSRVTSKGLYKGIDVTWYENDSGVMEYDFLIAPGADPDQVVLDFDGADRISVNASGDLEIETPGRTDVSEEAGCLPGIGGS